MERPPGQDERLQRLLSLPDRPVLVYGPAGCGKTSLALSLHRHFRGPMGTSGCWILTPNEPAARQTARRLLAEQPGGVIVAPRVMTFDGLARRILSAVRPAVRRLSSAELHLALRRVVTRLVDAGELTTLGGVAHTAGFVPALARTIAELKRATADPADLSRAGGTESGKNADLLKVYERYQAELQAMSACDAEGGLWLARDRLRGVSADGDLGLQGLRAVVVDGFTDFSPTQMEILALLRGRVERMVVMLPLPTAEDGRDRLWQWARRTHDRLREAFGGELEEFPLDAPSRDDSPAVLCDVAFRYDTRIEPPAGVYFVAAAGVEAEVTEAARRVKRLLIDGAQAGEIAVLARSLDAYRPAVERVFAEFEIPLRPGPRVLAEEPIVRFCLSVAALPQPAQPGGEGYDFRRVLSVLGNSYFRPEALGEFDASTVVAAETVVRRGNVLAGRAAYFEAAERLVRTSSKDEEADTLMCLTPANLKAAAEMLGRLFDLAETAQRSQGLSALIDALALRDAASAEGEALLVARDLRALEALERVAALAADEPTGSAMPEELARQMQLAPPRTESVVDVLDLLDARALRWRHVLLLGCSEGQLPHAPGESALLGEADRLAWQRRGARLDLRSDLTAREMLLFYLAVSRAAESLTLSYLHSDVAGKAAAPGSFLQQILDALGGVDSLRAAGRLTHVSQGRFVPALREIASPTEAVVAAVAGHFQESFPPNPQALAWVVGRAPQSLAQAVRGLWTDHRRWTPGERGPFDGRLTDPLLREYLAKSVENAVFSASRLSAYGTCPWRYFAQFVLHLSPLEEPHRELEPVQRGIFCHRVLFRALSGLADRLGRPLRLANVAESDLLKALSEAMEAEASRVEAAQPSYPALWRIQKQQMHDQLRDYLLAQRAEDILPPQCLSFELGFGQVGRTDRDSASRSEPVRIDTPAGGILLAGRIDRVDLVEAEGQSRLMVVDYKTGRMPAAVESLDGRNVQMPLYLAAVEQLLGRSALGGVFHSLRGDRAVYFSAVRPSHGKLRTNERFDDERNQAMQAVGRSVEGIRAGRFDLLPMRDACRSCPFRRICGYSPAREDLLRAAEGAEL